MMSSENDISSALIQTISKTDGDPCGDGTELGRVVRHSYVPSYRQRRAIKIGLTGIQQLEYKAQIFYLPVCT